MKKFNVCTTYGQTFLRGTRNAVEIPKGAFYGKDKRGLWYILDTQPYKIDNIICLEMYRLINNNWQVGMEIGDTVNLIYRIATEQKLWNTPQSKCLHMHSAVTSRTHTIGSRHTKTRALKDVSKAFAERGTYSNIYNYQ